MTQFNKTSLTKTSTVFFQGYFDEDSLDDFIASDSEETSVSLSSDEYTK